MWKQRQRALRKVKTTPVRPNVALPVIIVRMGVDRQLSRTQVDVDSPGGGCAGWESSAAHGQRKSRVLDRVGLVVAFGGSILNCVGDLQRHPAPR